MFRIDTEIGIAEKYGQRDRSGRNEKEFEVTKRERCATRHLLGTRGRDGGGWGVRAKNICEAG